MDFFIQDAYAQGASGQGDSTSFIIMMVLMFAAFYFLLIRPQQKKQKAHTALVGGLQVVFSLRVYTCLLKACLVLYSSII
jgi:preprotein translocase subunit YajC